MQSFCDSQIKGGSFFLNFELKEVDQCTEILNLVYQEFDEMLQGKFNQGEFEIAKTKALSNFYMEQEKLDDYTMSLIPFCHYSEKGQALQEYQSLEKTFQEMSSSDMAQYVKEHFDPAQQVVGLVTDIGIESADLFLWEERA